ncbi:S41 family peptidase [Archangium lansingense]|uniref:S41 family peptidase n=1 Tax=Archangium lansingense TaxID=2995310 RepID=A0ABT4A384_9BACT|nr:S41 family peptidase [Archangium lansinium]MCY1075739.1 S41 family peptidase [Archangium lansinium]
MRLKLISAAAMALVLVGGPTAAEAQVRTPVTEAKVAQVLSPVQRDAVLSAVKAAYQKAYVFPEKTPAILARLDKAKAARRYNVENPNELAGLLTSDLREASQDHHAFIEYNPQRYAAATVPASGPPGQDLAGFDAAAARRDNHGLTDMRILAGNVRYLRIAGFHWISDETGQAYDEAMRFLKGGDAVIIDLRGNGGGSSEAVQYLVSHFLKPGTLEITFLHAGREPVQTRALDNLPAGRMLGKPLYVLIDQGSASAAESFAYDVQQFKLGKLVGSGTAGAANNNDFVPIAPGFMLSVSTGRPVHPVSKSNWEGTGVTPEIATSSEQAQDAAHARALRELLAANPDPSVGADYTWALLALEARLHPVTPPEATLQAAPGTYGKYVVTAEKDGLWIARPGHPLWPAPRHLTPLTNDGLFAVDGVDMLRIGLKPNTLELWWKGEATPRLLKRD